MDFKIVVCNNTVHSMPIFFFSLIIKICVILVVINNDSKTIPTYVKKIIIRIRKSSCKILTIKANQSMININTDASSDYFIILNSVTIFDADNFWSLGINDAN